MGRWDRPWIRTGRLHRSSLWLSARRSTQRPGREYWAAPAQRRRLRTSPTLTGQDAITLLRLQRTPDQTITLSGSPPVQTAPTGFDSTDKWAPGGHPAIERREIKDLLRAKTALYSLSFLPSVPWYQTGSEHNLHCCSTPLTSSGVELTGSEELQESNTLFSPPIQSVWHCDYMDIFWTHCDDPFKRRPSPPPLSSYGPQDASRQRQRLYQRTAERGGDVMGHSKTRWAGTCAAASPQQ